MAYLDSLYGRKCTRKIRERPAGTKSEATNAVDHRSALVYLAIDLGEEPDNGAAKMERRMGAKRV